MKTATVREVRNEFGKLEIWLGEGETIEIRRRGKPVGCLIPPGVGPGKEPSWHDVDFEARRRRVSDRVLTQEDLDAFERFANEGQEG